MEVQVKAFLESVDYSIGTKALFGQKVCKCVTTENKSFPNLPLPLATLLDTTTNSGEAEQNAMSGNDVAIEKRNELNELWNAQLRKTAAYVSFTADGNATLIKSSGFVCTKSTGQKKGKIEIIDNFPADVKMPNGTAGVSCKSVKGANGYITIAAYEKAIVSQSGDDRVIELNGAQGRLKISTQCSNTLTNLPSKTLVGISMVAFNSAGISPLTDAQIITPQ